MYTQIDMVKTIEQILGLPPMNQMDAAATPMYNAFTDKADLEPYDVIQNKIPLDKMNEGSASVPSYNGGSHSGSFKDIDGHWAKDAIEALASKGIIKGEDENHFAPDNKITRAEFASMMIRLLNIPEEIYNNEFKDVTSGDWYAKAIEAAYKAGIIVGDGSTMRPNDSISREEMAAIVMRVYEKLSKYKEENINKTTFADDSKISNWAKQAIANINKIGLMMGEPNNMFAPKESATRAEAAAVIFRILNKAGNLKASQNELKHKWAVASEKMFKGTSQDEDNQNEALLNRAIWYSVKGFNTPYPGDRKVYAPEEFDNN
ncbi:S-layer homology domain-containing protein [Aceticella autotrophica]|uniref:S-layer homology domain-containing protein n=2 Tax=Aceticella autotrophica TaxID=2755338 RepID=A0A975AXX7_9THEO|nr:S-layer homology domain-containing protein [Aceticella autotrophica]